MLVSMGLILHRVSVLDSVSVFSLLLLSCFCIPQYVTAHLYMVFALGSYVFDSLL